MRHVAKQTEALNCSIIVRSVKIDFLSPGCRFRIMKTLQAPSESCVLALTQVLWCLRKEMVDQLFTDAKPASRISCDSARSSTARAMTIAPTNVAYALRVFCLLAAFDLPGTNFDNRSTVERT
jgi:hypothetical protein